MTYSTEAECAHCGVIIVDPTTRVIHGNEVYCCPNCAQATEQRGSGSDRHTLSHENDFQCGHCGVAIVDESTMATRDDQPYCCENCARSMDAAQNLTSTNRAEA
jgi:predicted RNA-binding Zn-ribbon protein involved in translation (DUF1610 family)